MKITIGHLYPDLLNLYGDRGNIQCMMKRCQWRGIEAETICYEIDDEIDFSKLDIVLLGGGSDREQMIVCSKLKDIKEDFQKYVEDMGVVLAICGGYQLLGTSYMIGDTVHQGIADNAEPIIAEVDNIGSGVNASLQASSNEAQGIVGELNTNVSSEIASMSTDVGTSTTDMGTNMVDNLNTVASEIEAPLSSIDSAIKSTFGKMAKTVS